MKGTCSPFILLVCASLFCVCPFAAADTIDSAEDAPFLLSEGRTPCAPKPWGSLTAVDLKSGEILWQKSLGSTRDLAPFPVWFDSGTPNFGGAMITAGGLVFATGTTDHFFRAYDVDNGELLWEERTDGLVWAVPASYRLEVQQQQYIVVAVSGEGEGETAFSMVAYALSGGP